MRANNFNIRKSKFLEGIEIHFQSRLTVNKTKVSEDLNEKRSICHSPETPFPEFSFISFILVVKNSFDVTVSHYRATEHRRSI